MAKAKENGTGTALAARPDNIPAILRELNAALAGDAEPTELELLLMESTETEEIELERVKMAKGGDEWFTRDGSTVPTLTGIIVTAAKSRGFWEKDSTDLMPFCSSTDGITGEVAVDITPDSARLVEANEFATPHPYAVTQTPENRKVKCATCPLSQFGSAKNGRAQACKESRRMLIHEQGKKVPILLTIPPTSLRPYKAYATRMTGDGTATFAVMTELGVKEESGGGFKYGIITLKKVGDLELEQVRKVIPLQKAYQAWLRGMSITGDDYEVEGDGGGQTIDGTVEQEAAPF